MTTISTNLQAVRARIAAAAQLAGRAVEDIRLLAVSKTFPPERIREAAQAGQIAFGENYLQESLGKIAALADLGLEWHFIGPLQSNKTRPVAEHFAWVHGVERLKIAERLSEARGAERPPLQVCIQVNVSGEASKSGVSPGETAALAQCCGGAAESAAARPDGHSGADGRHAAGAAALRHAARIARLRSTRTEWRWIRFRWACRTTWKRPSLKAPPSCG